MITANNIKKLFNKKTVLITGGTGSFGSTMLNKIKNYNCKIKVFSRDELKQDILRAKINSSNVDFIVGDVRDKDSVNLAMKNVDIVFHAAALKQVPSCEFFPDQATSTNILGSNNVFNSAIENNVKKVVALSTDKAVMPINSMGMTKALMEKNLLSKARNAKHNTTFSIVRYGNVIFSRGSVIPLFVNQIINNKNVTVTNPNMTRFLISLDEAISLVFLALDQSTNGDIFIKKSPAAKISQIAKCLLEIFNSNIKVKMIGIRHGEKVFETLATKNELLSCDMKRNYFKIKIDNRSLNYDDYFKKGSSKIPMEDYTSDNTYRLTNLQLKKLLLNIPEIKKLYKK